MNSTKNMLSVLMDGIKDAGMWLDYAKEAADEGKTQISSWFRSSAKQRIDGLDTMFGFVSDQTGLVDKVRAGDEIADALHDHVKCEIMRLKNRLSEME